MNCIPSGKLISCKNKKPPSSASEKYEQRIKDAKIKKNDQIMSPSWNNFNNNYNDYAEDWLRKISDIDNWRRNVTEALQNESVNGDDSVSLDTGINPDSSTLTGTSTLLSVGETYRKNVPKDPTVPRAIFDLNDNNIIISSSNNKQSSFLEPKCLPKEYYRNEGNRMLDNQSMEDEVFVPVSNPCYFSNSHVNKLSAPPKMQPLKWSNFNHNKTELHPKEFSSKYTPQAVKRPWYLPISKQEVSGAKSFDQSPPLLNIHDRNSKQSAHENWISSQDLRRQNDLFKNEHPNSSKRNLHKTETNAKLILRKSNSDSYNDSQFNYFRNSLNKPSTMNDFRHQRNVVNLPEKSQCVKVLNSPSITNFNDYKPRDFSEKGLVKNLSITNLSTVKNQQRFSLLNLTCSQENLSSRPIKDDVLASKMVKNNSFSNLRDQNNFIPKVSINKPLVLKFAFSSQVDLPPHYNNYREISIFS